MKYGHARLVLALSICIGLVACSVPRGAGFESEILAASKRSESGEAIYDFEVYAVTRASLSTFANWPKSLNTRHYAWLSGQQQSASNRVASGDRLKIVIWDAEENSLLTSPGQRVAQLQEVQVDNDGQVFVPFVGNLQVAGKSLNNVRQLIEDELVQTVPSAQVQVSILAGQSHAAFLVSGVARPGPYSLSGQATSIMTLISEGGGVAPSLVNPQLRLFRGPQVFGISVARLFEDPRLDISVAGGDRIVVEEEERHFLSLGAARSQSVHLFPKENISALDALAIVGGVSETRANPQGILVLREYPPHVLQQGRIGPKKDRVVFTIDLTSADGLFSAGSFAIESGDLVYATESPLTSARAIFGLISAGLGIANGF